MQTSGVDILWSFTIGLKSQIDYKAAKPMRHPFFRNQKVVHPEGAKPGGIRYVTMGPRGRPSYLWISLFIEHGGYIRRNGQDSASHQGRHNLSYKRLAEDFPQQARLRPSLRCPFNSCGIILSGILSEWHDKRDHTEIIRVRWFNPVFFRLPAHDLPG